MKFKPVGIFSEQKNASRMMNASDFSNDRYEGVQLRSTDKGIPVIIMQSRQTAPLMWKVTYGFSQVFFRTFAEAVDFCNSRGMAIMKEQVQS